MNIKNGSCLCGKVKIKISPDKEEFSVCHCGMCRRWAGGPAFTVDGGDNISFEGEEFIGRYDSSEWGTRGFCKVCGSHLFYHLKGKDYYNFSLGLFRDIDDFKFSAQIYIDSKPVSYEFVNKTLMLTENDVLSSSDS